MEGPRLDIDRWEDFKRTWSQEDLSNLESVLKKAKANADCGSELKDQLTKQEKAWTANFVVQAFLWGCCKENI
jgi:hypothetical protein